MYLSKHQLSTLDAIVNAENAPMLHEFNGLTIAALMSRDAIDVYVDGRGKPKSVLVKVRATSRGVQLLHLSQTTQWRGYRDCLAERRSLASR